MAKPTKLYPIKNRWVHDAPYGVHVTETKAEADELIASGAFSDDASNPDVDKDAPDLTVPVELPVQLPDGTPVEVPEPLPVEPEPAPVSVDEPPA